jgi:hypothetical protein
MKRKPGDFMGRELTSGRLITVHVTPDAARMIQNALDRYAESCDIPHARFAYDVASLFKTESI